MEGHLQTCSITKYGTESLVHIWLWQLAQREYPHNLARRSQLRPQSDTMDAFAPYAIDLSFNLTASCPYIVGGHREEAHSCPASRHRLNSHFDGDGYPGENEVSLAAHPNIEATVGSSPFTYAQLWSDLGWVERRTSF